MEPSPISIRDAIAQKRLRERVGRDRSYVMPLVRELPRQPRPTESGW